MTNYITPLASGLLDLQPLDTAFNAWICAADGNDAQLARCRVALACVDLLAEHTAREVMAAEETADDRLCPLTGDFIDRDGNVIGLFRRRGEQGVEVCEHGFGRRFCNLCSRHPSMGMGWRA